MRLSFFLAEQDRDNRGAPPTPRTDARQPLKTSSPGGCCCYIPSPSGDTKVTPLVHLLITLFNNSAISGAITNCTHGVTHKTPPVKFFSRVLIFWGISTGDVIYSIAAYVNMRTCETCFLIGTPVNRRFSENRRNRSFFIEA